MDELIDYVLAADDLKTAKLRFQECIIKANDPGLFKKVLWPFLFGNEAENLRELIYGENKSDP